ncbi:protein FRIGIDA-like [Solanum dulcamara]|uniref:protein FRIGIDA-like n=1 Tax=Solanum dulcamara TaxID=45834 RepID=UPI0024868C1B|nr:protein FRIGIDA-like [Solanum dulcamara]XP_055832538.1 protein FRIGIDA-like [Solanum dulcamara]XP_055832539.1 protein FRIGIDA-like [Solanum dulcamara]XP_055832540.1 protein FRIGIDA-like [Solanum dulcamara]
MDNSAAATPVSQPSPFSTQFQQSHSQVSITAANLRTFSDSLSAFQQCFNDLQRHIDSIQTSINSMLLPPQPLPTSSSSPTVATPAPAPEPESSWESDPSEDLEEEEEVKQEEKEVEGEGEGAGEGEGEGEDEGEEVKSPRSELKSPRSELKSPRSELEIFCETMDHHGLRKYMITHISNFRGLREEASKALRLSPSPASVVFKCIGKFYVTVGKKYANESPLSRGRKANVLLLECFLLMIGIDNKGVEIEQWVKEAAEQTALAWLERMDSEGVKPQEIDARGLLYFIGGFGIPDKFTNANIRNLLQVSNLKWASDALKRSNVLMAKFPEIIEEMVANKAVVKAIHIVYSVGMQDKFNPRTLLTTFIRESKKSFDNMNGSLSAHQGNIGVKGKYLSDLKSILKCLRYHEIDPSKVLPGWEFSRRIMSLEREITEFNKQIADKKMAPQNAGSRKRKNDGTVWLSNKEVKHSHFSNPWLPQHQRVVSNVISNNNLFEGGGTSGHDYGYFMPPLVLHGPVAGSIHENVGYPLAGPVRDVAIGGTGAGISASANSIHAGMDVVPQGVSHAGGHLGNRVDSIPGQIGSHAGQLYGSAYRPSTYLQVPNTIAGDSYRPAPFMESSKGLPNTIPGDSNRTPPYLEVSPGLSNTIPSNAYRPVPYMESSKGLPNNIPGDANRPPPSLEGSMELQNTIHGDAFRTPPYLEGSTGLPNAIPPPYQFPNTVPATELNQSSGSQAVDAHPSSSLYQQR